MREALRDTATDQPVVEYLRAKYSWTTQFFDIINWKDHSEAFENQPNLAQFSVSKDTHNFRLANERLYQFNYITYQSPMCLGCKEDIEDNTHASTFGYFANKKINIEIFEKIDFGVRSTAYTR